MSRNVLRSMSSLLPKDWREKLIYFVTTAVIFGVAYTVDPLYSDNQTTKYLQGLARAGRGYLDEDWLANTIDPLPAFTQLVQSTYQLFGAVPFYIYAFLAFGIYVYSLTGIVGYLFKVNSSLQKYLTFSSIFLIIHAIPIQIFSFKTHIHLHYGLADQYVLGHYFQPSMFGVLILFSIYIFLLNRPFQAVVYLAIASSFHPAYLPSAATLTLSYMIAMLGDRQSIRRVFGVGILAFVCVLPVFLYMTLTFQPTSDALWQQSQDLIVNFRIPHHSRPELWLANSVAALQIAIMLYAVYLVRRTRLRWVIGLPIAIAAVLVLVQIVSGSNTLAFTAPWRVSAVLMPLSTAIVLAAWITGIFNYFARFTQVHARAICVLNGTLITAAVLVGISLQLAMLQAPDPTREMMNFVKEQRQSGQVYLIPLQRDRIWDLRSMWQFRLYTGVPILVNVKSHPYKDTEVIEWYERVEEGLSFYEAPNLRQRCRAVDRLAETYSVSHIVIADRKRDLNCDRLTKVYEDSNYEVYSIAERQ